jgi:hypothetical protein
VQQPPGMWIGPTWNLPEPVLPMLHWMTMAFLVASGFALVLGLMTAWESLTKPGIERQDRVARVRWALIGGVGSIGLAFIIGFVDGLSTSTVGWLAASGAAGTLVMIVVGPPVLGLMDRLDRRWVTAEAARLAPVSGAASDRSQ